MQSMRFTALGAVPPRNWDEFQKRVTSFSKTALRGYSILAIKTLRGQTVDGMLGVTVVIEVALEGSDEVEFEIDADEVAGRAIVASGGRPGQQSIEVVDHAASSHTS